MDDLGVTIQLSTELVDQLRQWNEKPKHAAHHGLSTAGLVPLVPMFLSNRNRNSKNTATDSENTDAAIGSTSNDGGTTVMNQQEAVAEEPTGYLDHYDHVESSPITKISEWDDVMTLPVPRRQADPDIANDSDESSGIEDDSDDNMSMSPPSHLPALIVDLQAICGYTPTNWEEHKELERQVILALSTSNDDSNEDDDCRQFEEQAMELLQHNMAIQGNTGTSSGTQGTSLRYSIIPYPDYLVIPETNTVISTAREWKRLLQTHEVHVVETIFSYLIQCSQSLLWKINMGRELRKLAKEEQKCFMERNICKELQLWKTTKRKVQLDTLYQVRETLDHRLEMARQRGQELEELLSREVMMELNRRHGGLEALDLTNTEFAFPNEPNHNSMAERLSVNSDNDDDDDDVKIYRTIEESESESERVDSNDDLYDDNETTEAPAVVKVLPFVNSEARAKARRQATIKRQRRKLQKQQVASKLAFQEERLRQALMEGERVREQCKSQEYRMAQTIVQSLENRLQQVDDLIETLQEEEWADEEEFGANNNSSNVNNDDESKTVSNWFSLLDQILAMILGTIPIPQGKSQEEHFQFIKIEHTRIVQQWKSHFGRLPPMLSSKLTNIDGVNDTYSEHDLVDDVTNLTLDALNVTIVSDEAKPDSFELRTMLGITDNNEEWDSMDVWDVALPKLARPVIATDVKAPSTKAKSGLRPGGSVQ